MRSSAGRLSAPIELEGRELWFLLAQFGPGAIVGMGDPYRGLSIEEANEASQAAFRSLLQRGVIMPAAEHEVWIPAQLATALHAVHQPQRTVIVQSHQARQSPRRRFFHFLEDTLIEMAAADVGGQALRHIGSADRLVQELLASIRALRSSRHDQIALRLRSEIFEKVQACCRSGEPQTASELLSGAGMPSGAAQDFMATLVEPVERHAFVRISHIRPPSAEAVDGFVVLCGPSSTWIVSRESTETDASIEIGTVDREQLDHQFQAWLEA